MHALISIHDVMPETMDKVSNIINSLPEACLKNLVLLIVPGRNWQAEQIAQLREWQQESLILAGHGWKHEITKLNGLYHKLHSKFISRNAAEHLSLSQQEIIELMQRNYDWFKLNNLSSPDYYVPPAWAMGFIDLEKIKSLPFRYIETTQGIYDLTKAHKKLLPLSGFEADTRFRKLFLNLWNYLQRSLSSVKRPLRISIHPDDFELLLNKQLLSFLNSVNTSRHYNSL